MRIQSLQLRSWFVGRVVYVIGTGPSMRLFDIRMLAGQPTIALNQAWKYWIGVDHRPTLGLTVHPEHVLEQKATDKSRKPMPWATKPKGPLDNVQLDDPRYFMFHSGEGWDALVKRPRDVLFVGRGVQQTAMDLAARCGATAIVLVGVDMTDLGGEHHGHEQHVQFHGLSAGATYSEYRAFTAKARDLLWEHWRIPVVTMAPFVGVTHVESDYLKQLELRGLPRLPPPEDVSSYLRKSTEDPNDHGRRKSTPPDPIKLRSRHVGIQGGPTTARAQRAELARRKARHPRPPGSGPGKAGGA